MDETTLNEVWNTIESLLKVLTSISERLDRFEARADAMTFNQAVDPLGEREYSKPVH